ncbi:glycosyltransferase family A protein [Streptoalloteichus hindustanus]|uniref:glycosyltransferase family A protein n=1 Tax=Streptoalloteichus hindustanus TaxID=2017 RepID=UPI0009359FEB|nr:glycosyltransferase family A protein [Streptoalloteichus hindustanus]
MCSSDDGSAPPAPVDPNLWRDAAQEVVLVRHRAHYGGAAALNTGCLLASGDNIVMLDADMAVLACLVAGFRRTLAVSDELCVVGLPWYRATEQRWRFFPLPRVPTTDVLRLSRTRPFRSSPSTRTKLSLNGGCSAFWRRHSSGESSPPWPPKHSSVSTIDEPVVVREWCRGGLRWAAMITGTALRHTRIGDPVPS